MAEEIIKSKLGDGDVCEVGLDAETKEITVHTIKAKKKKSKEE